MACFQPVTFLAFPFLLLYCRKGKALLYALACVFCFYLWTLLWTLLPSDPVGTRWQGEALFVPHSLSEQRLFGKKFWVYKGEIQTFHDTQGALITQRTPCSVRLSTPPQSLHTPFRLPATLERVRHASFILKPHNPQEPPSPETGWHMAAVRHNLQKKAYKFFSIFSPHVASFLRAMTIGERHPLLEEAFRRVGLGHLFAISGFHFMMLGTLIMFLFGWWFPSPLLSLARISLMSVYALSLQLTPSIQRAWISCLLYDSSILMRRSFSALNALSFACCVELLLHPLHLFYPGFQLSYGITASLLLFFPSIDNSLKKWMIPRSPREMNLLPRIDRWGAHLLHFLRQALSLSISVQLIAIPFTWSWFGTFHPVGILYNLFFPLLSMVALVISTPLIIIHALLENGSSLPTVLTHLTSFVDGCIMWMLDLVLYLPRNISAPIALNIPNWCLVLYCSCLMLWSITPGWWIIPLAKLKQGIFFPKSKQNQPTYPVPRT